MKKIDEMTEQEILNLKDEEIEIMIKFRMAEEGIKMIEPPKQPEYFKIAPPNIEVYQCGLFGASIVFTDQSELITVINLFKQLKSLYKCDYNYNIADELYYLKPLENALYGKNIFEMNSKSCYTPELYNEIIKSAKENATMKKAYESELKEYNDAIKESQYIKNEIYNRVNEVCEKYATLNNYCRKFKFDYLPLAENDTAIAMNFLNKAYSLTEEQQEYVLANYNK